MTRVLTLTVSLSLGLLAAAGCGIGDAQQRLRTAVEAKRDELGQCYAGALQRDRNAAGEMRVWLNVDSDGGDVDSVEVIESPIGDPAFGQCVDGVLRTVQLDTAPKAALEVEYALTFRPEN